MAGISTKSKQDGAARLAKKAVRFAFHAPAHAQRVALVGDFTSWDRGAQLMQRRPDGTWETTVRLPRGRYEYKFLINDGEWLPDPGAPDTVRNEYGSENSIVEVK